MEAWKVLSDGTMMTSGDVMKDREMVIDEYMKLLKEYNIRRHGNINVVSLEDEEEAMVEEEEHKAIAPLSDQERSVASINVNVNETNVEDRGKIDSTSGDESLLETMRKHTSIQKRKQKMLAEVKIRSRQDNQIEYTKRRHQESKHVTPGFVVVVRVPKEQRSRTSAQGILGLVVQVSKQYSIIVVTEYGVIASGQPKQPLWISVDQYEVKTFNIAMMRKSLARKFEQIIVGKFNASQEALVSLADAHSKMLSHDFVGVRICKCKTGCKKGCLCRRNNSFCGSGCGCGGKCDHTLELSREADRKITLDT
jgi:hypothetical protein